MNNSEILIREYLPADIPFLASLCLELGYPTSLEDMKIRMKEISLQSNSKTIVAEKVGIVVGFIGMSKNLSWENNGCFLRGSSLDRQRKI